MKAEILRILGENNRRSVQLNSHIPTGRGYICAVGVNGVEYTNGEIDNFEDIEEDVLRDIAGELQDQLQVENEK